MSSANSDSFTSSLPIWMPSFSLYCLIILIRNTILNRSSESLIPKFRGKAFSFPPLNMILVVDIL